MATETPAHPDPSQKKIVQLYMLFGLGLVLSLVPNVTMALVSGCLILVVLIWAYMMRSGAEDGSLMENHMTFIIRTIWIGSLLAIATMALGAIYVFKMVDNTVLQPCIDRFVAGGFIPDPLNPAAVMIALEGCWDNYWQKNFQVFIIGGAIAAGPILLYFLARFARGFTRARGGYRIAEPKAWF